MSQVEMSQIIQQLKRTLETKEKENNIATKKLSLIHQILEEKAKADKESEQLQKDLRKMERLAAKMEYLASKENSRQNSTPEVREINQQIEEVLRESQKYEQQVNAKKTEIATTKHEIELCKLEQSQQMAENNRKLESMYQDIKSLRIQSSKTRYDIIDLFRAKQDLSVDSEIEVQNLTASILVYTQLINSLNVQLRAFSDRTQGPLSLKIELEKLSSAISGIPAHDPIPQKDIDAIKLECDQLQQRCREQEDNIVTLINQMEEAEKVDDNLSKEVHEQQVLENKLSESLHEKEAEIAELDSQIKDKQNRNLNKVDYAIEEINKLSLEKENQFNINREIEKKINIIKMGERGQGSNPIEQMRRRIESEITILDSKIQELTRASLPKARFNPEIQEFEEEEEES